MGAFDFYPLLTMLVFLFGIRLEAGTGVIFLNMTLFGRCGAVQLSFWMSHTN